MEQFNSLELWWSHNTTGSWKFGHQLNDTKEIDVGIVNGEIDQYSTSTTINPQPFFQFRKNWFWFFTLATKNIVGGRDLFDARRPKQASTDQTQLSANGPFSTWRFLTFWGCLMEEFLTMTVLLMDNLNGGPKNIISGRPDRLTKVRP